MSTTNPTRRTPISGHPGIYQLANGKYLVRFRNERGKVTDRTFTKITDAKRFKGKIDSGDKRGVDARMPFRAYAEHWIATYRGRKAHGANDNTRASYEHALRTQAIPFFGTARLERIDPPMLKAYVAHLEQQGYAANTVRRYFAPVRALLATAYEDGLLDRPVNIRLVLDKAPERVRDIRPLTAAETAALLAEIPEAHADLALMYATTGARLSEPLALRYRDLGHDPDGHPTVTFPRSKTEAGLKPIRLTPEMSQALTRRRAETGAGPDDLIFPSLTGTEIDGRNWRRYVFKPAAERAGVPWATPHMLRHAVGTLMNATGATAADIARVLRHADGGRLAQQTYVHPSAPDVSFIDTALQAARQPNNNPTGPQTPTEPRGSKTGDLRPVSS